MGKIQAFQQMVLEQLDIYRQEGERLRIGREGKGKEGRK